jgi:sugar phosphate isomerase/epimerase
MHHSDFEGAVRKMKDIGYEIAEPFGWKPPMSCPDQHRLVLEAGMQVCSGHYQPNSQWVQPHLDELVDQLAEVGARAWVMPGGYGGETVEEMKESAYRLRKFYHETLAPRGLKVEYHNHHTDIVPKFDGKSQVDLLLEYVPELTFQPDIGNAFLGDQTDTAAFLEHYGSRVTCLHIKDVWEDHASREKGKGSCATGEGIVDIPAAVAFAKARGIEDLIIEQEGAEGDKAIEDMLKRSYEYLASLL